MRLIRNILIKANVSIPVFRVPRAHPGARSRPIFIVGSGRSGNTLLRRLLSSGSEFFSAPETYVIGGLCERHNVYRGMPWSDYVRYTLGALATHSEFPTFGLPGVHEVARRLHRIEDQARSLYSVVDAFFFYFHDFHSIEGVRWIDKTPQNTLSIGAIAKTFPDAQFLAMLRDPVDVCSSYLEMGRYSSIANAAQRWKDSERAIASFQRGHTPEKIMRVRYEELVIEPERLLRSIRTFLGARTNKTSIDTTAYHGPRLGDVESRDHHSRVLQPIDRSSIGKGYRRLSPEQLDEVWRVVGREPAANAYRERATSAR